MVKRLALIWFSLLDPVLAHLVRIIGRFISFYSTSGQAKTSPLTGKSILRNIARDDNGYGGGVSHGQPLTHTELEIGFILSRWQSLPVQIRQTILILIQSLDTTSIVAQLPFKT